MPEIYQYFENQSKIVPSFHNVTRIIHQSWKTNVIPHRYINWAESWKNCFPNWTFILWTDENNENFVKTHYPWFYERFINSPLNILRVDSVRYLYLYNYGGIYADLDNICFQPFEHLLENNGIVFGDMQYPKEYQNWMYIQNSFMYSIARHPFWLDVMKSLLLKNGFGAPEELTGPEMLMHSLQENWDKYNDIKIYGPKHFNPFSWYKKEYNEPCVDLNLLNEIEFRYCLEFHKSSYVLQLHVQSWGKGSFSSTLVLASGNAFKLYLLSLFIWIFLVYFQ